MPRIEIHGNIYKKHAFVMADYPFLPHFMIPLTTVTVACEFLYCKI